MGRFRELQKLTATSPFQILNVTVGSSRAAPRRGPVNIVFAVKSAQGFWNGTQVSELLRNLSVVEFSFYLGYPVLQVAEREYHCPGLRRECGPGRFRRWPSFSQVTDFAEIRIQVT